jgi:tetratricopeptide (TPR) repeat protein
MFGLRVWRTFRGSSALNRATTVSVGTPPVTYSADLAFDVLLKQVHRPINHAAALKVPSSGHLVISNSSLKHLVESAPGDVLALDLETLSEGFRPIFRNQSPVIVYTRKDDRPEKLDRLCDLLQNQLEAEDLEAAEKTCYSILNFISSDADLDSHQISVTFYLLSQLYAQQSRKEELERLIAYLITVIEARGVELKPPYAMSLCEYATLLMLQLRFEEAEEVLQFGLTIEAQDTAGQYARGILMLSLTKLRLENANYTEAIEVGKRAEAIFIELQAETSDHCMRLLHFIGQALENTGDLEGALTYFERGVKALADETHPLHDLIEYQISLGLTKVKLELVEEGLAWLSKAFNGSVGLGDKRLIQDIAAKYGKLLDIIGRSKEALDVLQTALNEVGPRPELHCLEGDAYFNLKDLRRAEVSLLKALKLSEKWFFPEVVTSAAISLTYTYITLENLPKAEEALLNALERVGEAPSEWSFRLCLSLGQLLNFKEQKGRAEASEHYARKALQIATEFYKEGSPEVARAVDTLALTLIGQGKFEGVAEMLEQSISIKEGQSEIDAVGLVDTYTTYATLSLGLKDLDKTENIYLQAVEVVRKSGIDPDLPQIRYLFEMITQFHTHEGDSEGVEAINRAVEELRQKYRKAERLT